MFAGMTTMFPSFAWIALPPIVISASPSMICTTASYGAACSLKRCPPSNANSVIVPAFVSIRVLLTIESAEYSTSVFVSTAFPLYISISLKLYLQYTNHLNRSQLSSVLEIVVAFNNSLCALVFLFVAATLFLLHTSVKVVRVNNEFDVRRDEFSSCSDVVYPIVLC